MIDLVQRSTIHGINHIYSTRNRIFKAFWMFLFFGGLVAVSVNIVVVVKKYISNPITLNYDLNYEPFIWPELTFCNPTAPFLFRNKPNILKAWRNNIIKSRPIVNAIKNATNLFRTASNIKEEIELIERTVNLATIDPQKLEINNYENYFYALFYIKTHSGIYLTKDHENENTNYINQPLEELFTTQTVQHVDNIPCHTFHVDKLSIVNQNEIQSLMAIINFDYLSYKLFNSSSTSRKLLLYISKKNELPQKNPVVLLPGFNNVVRLTESRFHYNNLRRPCRVEKFQVKLYDALLQSTNMFEGGSDDCKTIISQELYVNECKCYSSFLPIYKNESRFPKLCLNASEFSDRDIVINVKCMAEVLAKYQEKSRFYKIYNEQCKKYENIECDTVSYITITEKEYLNELWTNALNDRRKDYYKGIFKAVFNKDPVVDKFVKNIRENVIAITLKRVIEYSDLYNEQPAYPFSELLSDIGGLMGLWMGMSIVGLFEIVEYFYLYIRKFFKKCGKNECQLENIDKQSEMC